MSGAQIGAMVGVAFACAWAIAGSVPLAPFWRFAGIFSAIVISAILLALVRAMPLAAPGVFDGALYGMAVTLEMVVIVVVATILNRSHRASFVPPAIAAIVGLHFVGLWRATNEIIFLWLAAALCGLGFVAMLMPRRLRLPVSGLGSAVALWASVIATLGQR